MSREIQVTHQNKPDLYQIYLLTIWAEQGQAPGTGTKWRFSLEDPRTGERRGFANMAALVTALHQDIARAGEISDAHQL